MNRVLAIGSVGLILLGVLILGRKGGVPTLGNLVGVVTDALTDQYLLDVVVELNGYFTTTDAFGYFEFTNIATGYYFITFSKEGYQSISQTFTLLEGPNGMNVSLTPV